jgi:uncharacterized membrane protein
MSGLLLGMVLSVCICWFHSMVTLHPRLVSTDFLNVHTSVLCLIVSLFPCICWSVAVHPLYHVFLYTVLLPVLGMLVACYRVNFTFIISILSCSTEFLLLHPKISAWDRCCGTCSLLGPTEAPHQIRFVHCTKFASADCRLETKLFGWGRQ